LNVTERAKYVYTLISHLKNRGIDLVILGGVTILSLLVHGYHPYAEDAAIYIPAIKKDLDPGLYPRGSSFFMSHARLTLFDEIVAGSSKAAHIRLGTALLLWHVLSIFLLLASALLLSEAVCIDRRNRWTGVGVLACVLTIPVAGTALLMMDPYLTPRSLSTPLALFAITATLKRRYLLGAACLVLIAAVHPLMAVYGAALWMIICSNRAGAFATVWQWIRSSPFRHVWNAEPKWASTTACVFMVPVCMFAIGSCFPLVDPAYHEALLTRSYFFLKDWAWYEWVGALAPLLLIAMFTTRKSPPIARELCRAVLMFGSAAIAIGILFSCSQHFETFAEIQPMRAFHPIYVIFFILLGCVLGDFALRRSLWRHALLLAPACAAMLFVQRATFPSDPHIEWPGARASNSWVQAFEWIREKTPRSAVFALDPDHMNVSGEDHQGFRAIAERSMMADYGKDTGVVTMFPGLAREWKKEVNARHGWNRFQDIDFRRLASTYGVSWVVLQKPARAHLECPYQNRELLVCQIWSAK
jgi:hypothetical protein